MLLFTDVIYSTPRIMVPLEKLIIFQIDEILITFHGTCKFSYQAHQSLQLFPLMRQVIHFSLISSKSSLSLFSFQCPGLQTRLFPLETLCAFLFSPLQSTFPSQLILLKFYANNIWLRV
jgi:hypothetical protein